MLKYKLYQEVTLPRVKVLGLLHMCIHKSLDMGTPGHLCATWLCQLSLILWRTHRSELWAADTCGSWWMIAPHNKGDQGGAPIAFVMVTLLYDGESFKVKVCNMIGRASDNMQDNPRENNGTLFKEMPHSQCFWWHRWCYFMEKTLIFSKSPSDCKNSVSE